MTVEELQIKTKHVCPPIPMRNWDWAAWFDGYEDGGGPLGRGRTQEDAIDDLNRDAEESGFLDRALAVVRRGVWK